MPIPVFLTDVIEAMEPLDDQCHAYLNRITGELARVTEKEAELAESDDDPELPEWQRDILPMIRKVLASDDFINLPDSFEFHEYHVIEQFCWEHDEPLQAELLNTIRGSGAFRRFKDLIHIKGIQDQWYAYREQALRELAMELLEYEQIPLVQ